MEMEGSIGSGAVAREYEVVVASVAVVVVVVERMDVVLDVEAPSSLWVLF